MCVCFFFKFSLIAGTSAIWKSSIQFLIKVLISLSIYELIKFCRFFFFLMQSNTEKINKANKFTIQPVHRSCHLICVPKNGDEKRTNLTLTFEKHLGLRLKVPFYMSCQTSFLSTSSLYFCFKLTLTLSIFTFPQSGRDRVTKKKYHLGFWIILTNCVFNFLPRLITFFLHVTNSISKIILHLYHLLSQ